MEKYKIGPNIRNYIKKYGTIKNFTYNNQGFTVTASRLKEDARKATQTHQ